MTKDFATRTRARVAEARVAIERLREVGRETIRQLAKIDKQHVADRTRLYDKLGQIADDMTAKLPEEATDDDFNQAHAIQEQVNDLASEVDEVSLAGNSVEDLGGLFGDSIREIYRSLKESEAQLA